jgi:riboflavin kinase / FMN adenylyltransferase
VKLISHAGSCPDSAQGSVVTMGNYDGVHRGHRAVIHELASRAASLGAATALVTYEPHTAWVIHPRTAPHLLTSTPRKLELLAEAGLDYACVLTFDEKRRHQQPEDFVREILARCLHAREVVVGADVRFGSGARGSLAMLEELGPECGFAVRHLELVVSDGDEKVSSSRIRRALERGDVEWAAWALERPHEVAGPVIRGDRRGSRLGFPTANLDIPDRVCLPADGVYAGWARLAEHRIPTVVSVGTRPQFYEHEERSIVEAHLFGFDQEIYGQELVVELHRRIRSQLRFESVAELSSQMTHDAEEARRLLGM